MATTTRERLLAAGMQMLLERGYTAMGIQESGEIIRKN
jgi:AcrR family transcriptional regulator